MITDELSINISADVGNAAQNITNTANALDGLGDSAKTADSDMSEFVKAMSDAATNMMSVSASIQTSVSGLTSFQTGLDGAVQSVTNLSTASSASATALNGIVSATGNFESRMDALSDTTHGTTVGMVQLQHTLNEALSSMRSFSDNMTDAGKDAADAAQHIRELSAQVKAMPTQQPLALAEGFKKLKSIVMTLGIAKFVKDSNDAYETQMTNELKLTAHMKHRMNATDDEIKAIKELASAQQKIGVIGDEIQLAGAQQLTTYARQSSTLKTLIPAMNNLIAQNAGYDASAGDAKSAADMLGRALNGQYTGLQRLLGKFSEAQIQVLKYGTEEEKAAVLADAINSKIGNMNELLNQTPTGQLNQLRMSFGDLQEEIGATFQPLISSIIPILRSALEMIRVPIINVSRGISVIGQAISSIDTPVVRAIGLAAASIAILSKLKVLIGSTSAGLLLLGLAVAAVTGSMVQQQDNIGDIVENAYKSAQNAANGATDAMSDFGDETDKTEKKLNRLAGFDTITKLSGSSGTYGAIGQLLLGNNATDVLNDVTSQYQDFKGLVDSTEAPTLDFTKIKNDIGEIGELFNKAFTGSIDEQYAALTKLDSILEQILGPLYTETLKPIGDNLGSSLYYADQAVKAAVNGDIDEAVKQAAIAQSKLVQFNPLNSEERNDALNRIEADVIYGSGQLAYDVDKAFFKPFSDFLNSLPYDEKLSGKLLPAAGQLLGNALSDLMYGAGYEYERNRLQYSEQDLNYAIINELRKGLAPDQAVESAKSQFITSADMQEWFDKYVNIDMTTVRQWQDNLMQTGQISDIDYRNIPSTSNVTTAGMPNINIGVTLDGDEISAKVVQRTDSRNDIENGK